MNYANRHEILKQIAKYIVGLQKYKNRTVKYSNSDTELERAKSLMRIITPHNVTNVSKVRLGGNEDGGYVMLDPGINGIAYSFGVSTYAPWDMDMAKRGFRVIQYDGTVPYAPERHPNIVFFRNNITAVDPSEPGCKNIRQIFEENQHQNEHDIILQIDIEGAEWDFFANITDEQIMKFKQIIVELHKVFPDSPDYEKFIRVLNKINKTHQSVHVHGNNHGIITFFQNELFVLPQSLEVTYARKGKPEDGLLFTESTEYYPTQLDRPNNNNYPDIPLGIFSNL